VSQQVMERVVDPGTAGVGPVGGVESSNTNPLLGS